MRQQTIFKRRFEAVLSEFQYWDSKVQAHFDTYGVPTDCILQDKQELYELCLWIESKQIRSYLEIGIWTGKMVCFLDRLFGFEKLAVCDIRAAEYLRGHVIDLPEKTHCFWGDSHSIEFMAWRQEMGHFDLVFIDGDHSYAGVKQDFQINKRYPHGYLAFHDIAMHGPSHFWQELAGDKFEIKAPTTPPYFRKGIGIWRAQPR